MKISKIPLYVTFTLCLITTNYLFYIKDRVNILKKELTEIQKQIKQEEDTISILKAEFAYLTHPERLKSLAKKYLDLDNATTLQLTSCLLQEQKAEFNNTRIADKRENNIKSFSQHVKWRYKHAPEKFVTKVAKHNK